MEKEQQRPYQPQAWLDDVVDDLQSMSFNSATTATDGIHSSTSSSSETTWTTTSTTFPSSTTRTQVPIAGEPFWEVIRRAQLSSLNASTTSNNTAVPLSFSDIKFICRLGAGDIGSVYLAELNCAGGVHFAAKVMDINELATRNKEGRARTEKEILEILDHPFLPTLYASLESPKWSCLLTEFCPGGDLHVLRQRQPFKRFEQSAARFYASEVVVALEYVHMMGIVYRDLKPENVLVRSDGHVMLTDFDLSLKCDETISTPQIIPNSANQNAISNGAGEQQSNALDQKPQFSSSSCILPNCIVPAVSCFHLRRKRKKKTNRRHAGPAFVAEPIDVRSMSFVGTHEYLAPEIVSGDGHGSAVDWWTLGIFIFELFYGVTPFKGVDNELTLANIVARSLEFPKEPSVPPAAKDLISQLLVKDPQRRLGSVMGASPVKQHPFFQGVNWALLRCNTPPFVPPKFYSRDLVVSDDSCPNTPVDYY